MKKKKKRSIVVFERFENEREEDTRKFFDDEKKKKIRRRNISINRVYGRKFLGKKKFSRRFQRGCIRYYTCVKIRKKEKKKSDVFHRNTPNAEIRRVAAKEGTAGRHAEIPSFPVSLFLFQETSTASDYSRRRL